MKKFSLAFSTIVLFAFSFTSCKKINEATELGGGLIPAVDNITTFDTVLSVETTNGVFDYGRDSNTSTASGQQFLGIINNDPVFGKITASMYFELKPSAYPFTPINKDSLIALDSVVLVLAYTGTYGDRTKPQRINVHKLLDSSLVPGSIYPINRPPGQTLGPTIGPTKTFVPERLTDSVFAIKERAANQLRIPLNTSFGVALITGEAFKTDSAFQSNMMGFAVIPEDNGVANALVGFNLLDTNTKLTFYCRTKNGSSQPDTTVFNIRFSTVTGVGITASGSANYIKRDSTGSEMLTNRNSTQLGYISNAPGGGFVQLAIPALASLSNRVIHRAELLVEQVPDVPLSDTFPPPQFLYLDALDYSIPDSSRSIPYDVQFSATGSLYRGLSVYTIENYASFGMVGKKTTVGAGSVYRWNFDISRYVQHVVNNTDSLYTLRLSAPYILQQTIGTRANSARSYIPINSNYAIGRVRVGGGSHPTQRMRLRIVYSKI